MDAVEFLRAKDRICGDSKCETCMLKAECFDYYYLSTHYWDEMVATVEHWVRDNPERTRQTELLKMFPDCKMDSGVPVICPKSVDKNYKGDCNICEGSFCCADCRDAYWSMRV